MATNNLYEDVVNEVWDWVERISDEVAPEVMGGKRPPFSVSVPDSEVAEFERFMQETGGVG